MKTRTFLWLLPLCIMLAATFSFCSCDDDSNARIVGALTCHDTETHELLHGLFIVTNKNDSILAFNLPEATITSLTGGAESSGMSTVIFVDIPVEVIYRYAVGDEIKEYSYRDLAMLPPLSDTQIHASNCYTD